ncbi:UNVERIFIED_CONTAM: hypothetical protein K2H54_062340 [Gekko kuhli]
MKIQRLEMGLFACKRLPGLFSFAAQVSQDGKSLLDKLQRPLTPGSSDSLTASANYSKAVHHVLDIIHEVLHHQRQLENIWQHRKVRLHQRLQLCVFQQDVQQASAIAVAMEAPWEMITMSQQPESQHRSAFVCFQGSSPVFLQPALL